MVVGLRVLVASLLVATTACTGGAGEGETADPAVSSLPGEESAEPADPVVEAADLVAPTPPSTDAWRSTSS